MGLFTAFSAFPHPPGKHLGLVNWRGPSLPPAACHACQVVYRCLSLFISLPLLFISLPMLFISLPLLLISLPLLLISLPLLFISLP
jgi:hypothetical protein